MGRWWRVGALGLCSGLVTAVALQRPAGAAAVVAYDLVVLAVGVTVGAVLVRRLSAGSGPRPPVRSRPAPPTDVRLLNDWESVVTGAGRTLAEAHGRLRPRLRGLAAERLARRGVDLDAQPERARAVLGEDAWEWLRPDRPAPRDRRAPGPPPEYWARVVAAVERAGEGS